METKYINFFPGDMRHEREIFLTDSPAYGLMVDLGEFVDSIANHMTSSIALDGIKDALEDGEVLKMIYEEYAIDEIELQEIVEELHSAI